MTVSFLVLAQVMISWVVGSSPRLGNIVSRESASGFSLSFRPSPLLAHTLTLLLSLSQINKSLKNK